MNIFDSVAFPKNKRNVFNLSHEYRGTTAFGQLRPIFCEEVLPGDTFQLSSQMFVRAMPMLAPLMHRVNVYTHFFFVPNRLVWRDWKDFITGGEDGNANPILPYITLGSRDRREAINGSLADHLGCHTWENPEDVAFYKVNALPFRAYNLIWNHYYRDQNLQDEIVISKESGEDGVTPVDILLRNWEKDYFTSALPWTQRGTEAISPLHGENEVLLRTDGAVAENYAKIVTAETAYENRLTDGNLAYTNSVLQAIDESGAVAPLVALDPNGTLYTDMNGSFFSVNELRRAIALQRWLEANARGGSRYIEQIFSHFGVVSSDARLQRPEYLGGGKQPLSISEVLQTSESTDNSPLGDMAGHGVSAACTKQFRRYFEEHGFVIGIMSIMPKPSYCSGTRRFMHKFDRFDYAFPEFANLGEQAVWNSEIWQGNRYNEQVGEASGTFGYQSRYSEYKYIPNSVHGALKDDAMSPWTLVRKFTEKPSLNSEFIDVNSSEEELWRIFSVDSELQFVFQGYHNFKAVRILPKHVIPTI